MSLSPPRWTLDEFVQGADSGIEAFRAERLNEAREDYSSHFNEAQASIEDLLELTIDLTRLRENANVAIAQYYGTVRYLTAPPISHDDLQTLSGIPAKSQLTAEGVAKTIEMIILLIDRKRFPWLLDGGQPSEVQKRAAIVATATQIASSRVQTARRNEAKEAQEALVKQALMDAGFRETEPRVINTSRSFPSPGTFCGESMLGTRKADIVVGLWDERALAIECKVSNSSVNSVKRVKNDAGSKAVKWLQEFGTQLIVPAAVIAGVYHPPNLLAAQYDGLTIWWSHDIDQMIDWIGRTR
ncbi:XamI family restriction endonuclease [Actinoplanes sp. NPDC049596]|uniref:XamI family restriction endonuclease n=1 Tax=unclassified Actinoplanes TaxID=2626549 RepID=UPI003420076E